MTAKAPVTTSAPTTTATLQTTAAPATAVTPVVIKGQGCDLRSNVYLANSPGTVDSLEVCSELCQASSQCQSLTYDAEQYYCSHFSTKCTSVIAEHGATTVRFPSITTSIAGWTLVGYGKECDFDPEETYLENSSREVASL